MNYYISDLHFGWKNQYEGKTLETDNLIIENWNNVVTNADDVYILGDIGKEGKTKDNEELCKKISVLKGRKHLIVGNHDALKDIRITQLFTEICDYKRLKNNFKGKNFEIILSHYPILFWEGQHRGAILLYGHLHNSVEEEWFREVLGYVNLKFMEQTIDGRTDCPTARAFNVGCMMDYMNYTPITLEQLLERNEYAI